MPRRGTYQPYCFSFRCLDKCNAIMTANNSFLYQKCAMVCNMECRWGFSNTRISTYIYIHLIGRARPTALGTQRTTHDNPSYLAKTHVDCRRTGHAMNIIHDRNHHCACRPRASPGEGIYECFTQHNSLRHSPQRNGELSSEKPQEE